MWLLPRLCCGACRLGGRAGDSSSSGSQYSVLPCRAAPPGRGLPAATSDHRSSGAGEHQHPCLHFLQIPKLADEMRITLVKAFLPAAECLVAVVAGKLAAVSGGAGLLGQLVASAPAAPPHCPGCSHTPAQ